MAIAIVALVGTFLAAQPVSEAESYAQQFALPADHLQAAADTVGVGVRQYLVGEGLIQPPVQPTAVSLVWDRLASCESTGIWNASTGNGYYGGLQFDRTTWLAYGGGAYAPTANLASKTQQIAVAEKLRAARGFQPWPACSRRLGLR